MISGLEPDQIKDLILSVGVNQPDRALTPIEVGLYLQRAIEAGQTPKEIAEVCLLNGTTMIGRFTKLLALSEKLHHLVTFGHDKDSLSFTQAMEISGLKETEKQEELAELVLEKQISKDDIRAIRQIIERSDAEVREAVDRIIKLRPKTERIWVFIGLIYDKESISSLKSLTQVARDTLYKNVLVEIGLEASGHLDSDRFTLITESSEVAKLSASDIERLVNEGVKKLF